MEIRPDMLKFGAPAAERDSDLCDCFVFSESFKNIKDKGKNILLGNRGTGKSAIFKKLRQEEEKKGNLIISLAPEDYSYELLNQTILQEKQGAWAKHGAYAAAWKYLIYVLIMKEVVARGKSYKKGAEAEIYNYLRDHHKNVESNPIGALISYLKRLDAVKIGPYEAGIKARELQNLYKLEEISKLLPALELTCDRHKVFVLVDELDRGWDNSEDAKAFVAGLFQAAVSINLNSRNIRVLISLRKELYDNIPELYEDAQKVRDIIEEISWDEDTLLELISRRIAKSVPVLSAMNNESRWNKIFSEVLEYRTAKSFNYIVDRTLYRPREIIQFCNDVNDMANTKSRACPYDYSLIAESEYKYSEGRLKDIAAEWRFQYPGLMSVFETFRGQSYLFSCEELEEHILRIVTGEITISDESKLWCNYVDPEYVIDSLWKIGFLRAQAVGGLKAKRRSGSQYLGPHQISSLNLRNIPRFQVHPMFRSFLGLKEAR